MTDGHAPKPPGRVRGRPFEKSRSGNPLGRRVGCRNKTTIAAAALLAGEAEALTRNKTSDFERRLRLVEADHFDHPGEAAGIYGAGPGRSYHNL
jgi:hypothetical protein